MKQPHLVDVTPETLPQLQLALNNLATDLGDPYNMGTQSLHAALFGRHPAACAVLALDGADDVLGAALFSPVVSTSAGGAGVYVSDLWVAEHARGQAIGRAVLAHVAARAQQFWQARFMRLASYTANPRAGVFYTRLGFVEKSGEVVLQLPDTDFEQLDR